MMSISAGNLGLMGGVGLVLISLGDTAMENLRNRNYDNDTPITAVQRVDPGEVTARAGEVIRVKYSGIKVRPGCNGVGTSVISDDWPRGGFYWSFAEWPLGWKPGVAEREVNIQLPKQKLAPGDYYVGWKIRGRCDATAETKATAPDFLALNVSPPVRVRIVE